MTEKKDVKDIIQKEETHLNNLLEQQDLTDFKGMVEELRDTWNKKQVFRTETEARFSVDPFLSIEKQVQKSCQSAQTTNPFTVYHCEISISYSWKRLWRSKSTTKGNYY